MPRKSANQLEMEAAVALLPGGEGERPEPPAGMAAEAAAVWRDVVSSMKARHFTRETFALLTRYCSLMGECERIEAALAGVTAGAPDHDRLNQRLSTTAMAALSYGRALRLTPKSNLETRADARDPYRTAGLKPWEISAGGYDDFGNPRTNKRKPWEG